MTSLEEFKSKQLEILHELDRVCNLAGIDYYLAYGTCLGAVRHKGFIPWDDDIDVFLTCDQMELLLKNANLFRDKYFLQTPYTDKKYGNMKYSLRDSSTAYFSDEEDCDDINHGMFIDLYVLYPYPDNWLAAHKLIIDSYIMRILYLKRAPKNHGKFGKIAFDLLKAVYSGNRSSRKIKRIESKLQNNGGSRYYASFFGDDITPISCFKFPKECFEKPVTLQFEDFEAPCPSKPELICELTYGKTYMEYPPVEKRVSRHLVRFMSATNSYKEYEGVYYYKDC